MGINQVLQRIFLMKAKGVKKKSDIPPAEVLNKSHIESEHEWLKKSTIL